MLKYPRWLLIMFGFGLALVAGASVMIVLSLLWGWLVTPSLIALTLGSALVYESLERSDFYNPEDQ